VKESKIQFLFLTNKIINAIKYKKLSFFNKVDKNYFFAIDNAIATIVSFMLIEINNIVLNILIFMVSLTIMLITSPLFVIPIAAIVILSLIITFINNNFQKKILIKTLDEETKINLLIYDHINFLENEANVFQLNDHTNRLQKRYVNFLNRVNSKNIFDSNLSLILEIINFTICIVVFGISINIISKNDASVSYLIYISIVFGYLTSSIDSIFNFANKYICYEKMCEIYNNFTNIENIVGGKGRFGKVKSIKLSLNNHDIKLVNGSRISSNALNILSLKENNTNLMINGIKTTDLDIEHYFQHLICINPNTKLDINLLKDKINYENTELIKALEYFKINISTIHFNNREQQIINILFLIGCRNNIIYLNNCFKYANKDDIKVLNDIIKIIKKNNFIIYGN
jgi:hypothetical protein